LPVPDGGEVYVNGAPTSGMDDAGRTRLRREEIGFVYQFHHLLPEFSAHENVVLPQLIRGLDKAEAGSRASELLSFLGLSDRLRHNLDPQTARHVFSTLNAIVRASGLAALVATHNLELAAGMDRRVTIRDGAVVPLP
jgi:lipoprotein-releasing system ATP-binding protein